MYTVWKISGVETIMPVESDLEYLKRVLAILEKEEDNE